MDAAPCLVGMLATPLRTKDIIERNLNASMIFQLAYGSQDFYSAPFLPLPANIKIVVTLDNKQKEFT